MLNWEQMLAPLNASTPCGEDLSFAPELDAIAAARRADDPELDQGAWVRPLKEADWVYVSERCAELLASRSKDLQLAVWLCEALVRQGDSAGLAAGLQLCAALCRQYWDALYPLPEDGQYERRIGNLCWLAAQLPAWLAALPAEPALRPALQGLAQVVDSQLGDAGPSFQPALAALHDAPLAPMPATVVAAPAQVQGSRAEAIAQLRQVASWFRRHEPHSPAAYLAARAADWAEQDLEQWLRTVIKDPATLATLEETLGIKA